MNRKAANSLYLKRLNRLKILQHLRREPCSRADLARKTGLSRAAITILTEELLGQRFLLETGTIRSEAGRRPMLLKLNENRYHTVGVSIARDKTSVGLVDFEGRTLRTMEVTTEGDAEQAIDATASAIRTLLREDGGPILGIGVIAPGPLDIHRGVLLQPPNFEKWRGVAVGPMLQQALGLPVCLENNPNALAIAERNYGCGPTFESMMVLTVDSGIGAGIILQGGIYRGVGGFGNEVGHTSINIDGPRCDCGNYGCLELYAARQAYLRTAAQMTPPRHSWSDIVEGALYGNSQCGALLELEANYLGQAIVNVLNLLELEAVVLSGDVVYKPELLLTALRKRVDSRAMFRAMRQVTLQVSQLPPEPEILCAASAMIEKYFSGEREFAYLERPREENEGEDVSAGFH